MMGMTRTLTLRSLYGIVFAAVLALSLISATTQALAVSRDAGHGAVLFDPGFTHSDRPLIGIGDGVRLLGITWE
jgi:hypothetical protein